MLLKKYHRRKFISIYVLSGDKKFQIRLNEIKMISVSFPIQYCILLSNIYCTGSVNTIVLYCIGIEAVRFSNP